MTREVLQIVEIVQPLCANTFGVSPCTATTGSAGGALLMETGDALLLETGDRLLMESTSGGTECYNTRATCQDTANYDGSSTLSLYFSKGGVAAQSVSGANYIIPSLVSVSTAPTKINLASTNPDAKGLGNRAVCSIQFKDHPHTDRLVDPYLSNRTFDPYQRASFWSKWLVRNKYRQNIRINIYEGYAGEALSAMTKRSYFLQRVTGPDSQGNVTVEGMDILARIEERKAQAPVASPGELYADITAGATSFEVAGAVEADYGATGTLRIGDELMTYSARATSANGLSFTISARGTDGTTAATHSAEDAVQECLRYTDARVDDIVEDLLTTYGNVPSAFLDTTNWATEVDSYLSLYLLSTVISEPTAVTDLVSELQESAMCFIWWDERDALVKFKAIRGIDTAPPTITAEANILAGSFSMTEQPRERSSQVWVYFDHRNFVDSVTEPKSYRQLSVFADLESETDALYGEPSIRKVFSRWLQTGALADTTASKIITRYVDIPNQCKFRMDAKDRDYWVGDTLTISHHLDVDETGQRRERNWTIISAEEVVPGETVEYVAEDTTLYGQIVVIQASGAADYVSGTSSKFDAFIGNAAGLLSDGEICARIN